MATSSTDEQDSTSMATKTHVNIIVYITVPGINKRGEEEDCKPIVNAGFETIKTKAIKMFYEVGNAFNMAFMP